MSVSMENWYFYAVLVTIFWRARVSKFGTFLFLMEIEFKFPAATLTISHYIGALILLVLVTVWKWWRNFHAVWHMFAR